MKIPFVQDGGESGGTLQRISGTIFGLLFVAFPFVILISVAAILSLWQFRDVRALALRTVGDTNPRILERALDDPSAKLRKKACRELIRSGSGLRSVPLFRALVEEPSLAVDCLEAIEARRGGDGESGAGSSYVPHHRVLAHRLVGRWYAEITRPKREYEFPGCRAIRAIRRMGPLASAPWESYLAVSAILASSEQVRRCAVSALGGDSAIAEFFGDSQAAELGVLEGKIRALVAVAFSEMYPSDKWHGADALPAGVDTVPLRDWVFGGACRMVFDYDPDRSAIRAFAPAFENQACTSGSPPGGYYRPSTWISICSSGYDYQRLHEMKPPDEALCRSLENATVEYSVGLAQRAIHVAVRQQDPGVVEKSVPSISGRPTLGDRTAPSWVLQNRQRQFTRTPALRNLVDQLGPLQ